MRDFCRWHYPVVVWFMIESDRSLISFPTGSFKAVLIEENPDSANALTARFVLAIKSNTDRKIEHKARYFIGTLRLTHALFGAWCPDNAVILCSNSCCFASSLNSEIWSSDLKLVDQSSEQAHRPPVSLCSRFCSSQGHKISPMWNGQPSCRSLDETTWSSLLQEVKEHERHNSQPSRLSFFVRAGVLECHFELQPSE